MIPILDELNRIMVGLVTLRGKEDGVEEAILVDYCNTGVFGGRLPDHRKTIAYCEQIGMVVRREGYLLPTNVGTAFCDLNTDQTYELNLEQKQMVLRNCFLHGLNRREVYSLLERFKEAYGEGTFRLLTNDEKLKESDFLILEHLRQLGVIKRNPQNYEVEVDYVDTIADFRGEGLGWSEEAFKEFLREKEEVGDLAEEFALRYEEHRLKTAGCQLEASCARRISKLRVNAGYDLESFDGKSTRVKFNRFIEVKGSRGSKVRFFWTENEQRIAKKLGKSYWIYFIGGISLTGPAPSKVPVMIHDPYNTLFSDSKWSLAPQGFIVEAKR